jgi:hypothetical protein
MYMYEKKEKLLAALELVRASLCSYAGGRCDCKYGRKYEVQNRG